MSTAYGYIRVSTQDQADNGASLALQRRLLEEEIGRWVAKGFAKGQVYEDRAESGSRPFLCRPAGHALSIELQAGDAVLFTKVDRGFRKTSDLLETVDKWKQRGVRAVFLDIGGVSVDTGTAMGWAILAVAGVFAELERRRISERTKEVLAEKRRQGVLTGGSPPFGTRREKGKKYWLTIAEEWDVGIKILEWIDLGHTHKSIARHLNDHNVPPHSRKRFSKKRARKLRTNWTENHVTEVSLKMRRNLELVKQGKIRFCNTHKPPQYPKESSDGSDSQVEHGIVLEGQEGVRL